MANKLDSLPVVDAPTRAEWRAWLLENHQQPTGVWLVLYRKGSGRLTYPEAVEEALCFGWIDSVPRKIDEERRQQYFSPRKKGSVWSAVNKQRLAELAAAGLLHPSGQAKIAAAQQDGSWTLLDAVERLELPPDLAAALSVNEVANQHFTAYSPSVRKMVLQRLLAVKRPETRQQHITRIVERAARNERPF
ncbi:YdeI/OmpD-associated family protein [Hymenobacter pini]|uniref:YdeI/OmpD-associated family protein n=1 Tax=Hymenobacter pini TaxID=2880879 RepID=UPI001CF4F5F0|nr:YdeI/OmpD-associated family protein [Hymenobacter pini]MCA8829169.1 YdeI/OmpD-associated family protein [Hymenobacter pini]